MLVGLESSHPKKNKSAMNEAASNIEVYFFISDKQNKKLLSLTKE